MDANRTIGAKLATAMLVVLLAGCGKQSPEALTSDAKNLLGQGNYKAATIQLRNALQKQPENGEARYLLGVALIDSGEYPAAEKELRKALEYGYSKDSIYPALAKAMLRQGQAKNVVSELGDKQVAEPASAAQLKTNLGFAHLALGQRDEARAAFQAALTAQPGFAQARVGEAMLAAADRDLPAATKIVDEVLAQSPKLPEALSLKADLLIAGNDLPAATKVLQQVVEIEPANATARVSMISLLIQQQKLDEARAAIDSMKQVAKGDVRTTYLEALLAYRQGDFTKTRDAALQVLKVLPNHVPSQYLAGIAYYRLGSLAAAEENLRSVVNRMPQSDDARSLLVATQLGLRKPERAAQTLEPALKAGTRNPKLLRLAGEVALANGDLHGAAQYYQQASDLNKDDASIKTRLGQVRFATGDVDSALSDFESASELDADHYQADLAQIAVYVRRREYDKALDAAKVLEKKQPKNPLTYNVKGVIYGAKNDLKSARANFDQALALKPDYLPAVRNLALLDLRDKKPDAAKARFEAVIKADPKNDLAILALAEVQAASGASAAEVRATLDRAVAANPGSVAAKVALINFYLRTGDAKAALALAETVSAGSPDDPRLLELLGNAQLAAGNTNQAIQTFTKLAGLRPRSPDPLIRLAGIQVSTKNYGAAIEAVRKAIALKPDLPLLRRELAMIEFAGGKLDDALKEAKSIQKDFPNAAVGYVLEGDLQSSQKQWAAATKLYRDALKRESSASTAVRLHAALLADGKSSEADAFASKWLKDNTSDVGMRSYLADRSLRQKDYKTAMKYYEEAIALQPSNPLLLNNLAWVANEVKDPRALEYASKAYALAPAMPAVADTYGWFLFKKGDVKQALPILTDAAKRAEKSQEIRLHFAQALIGSGDKAAARKELEAVVQLDPKSPQGLEADALLKKP